MQQYFELGADAAIDQLLLDLDQYGKQPRPLDKVDLDSQVRPLITRQSSVEQPPVCRLPIDVTPLLDSRQSSVDPPVLRIPIDVTPSRVPRHVEQPRIHPPDIEATSSGAGVGPGQAM